MTRDAPMAHLTSVVGSFHARVLAARLEAEGIAVGLEGSSEGPYPFPADVSVLVAADDLELAREILLADEVDAALGVGPARRGRGLRVPGGVEAAGDGAAGLSPARPERRRARRRGGR